MGAIYNRRQDKRPFCKEDADKSAEKRFLQLCHLRPTYEGAGRNRRGVGRLVYQQKYVEDHLSGRHRFYQNGPGAICVLNMIRRKEA